MAVSFQGKKCHWRSRGYKVRLQSNTLWIINYASVAPKQDVFDSIFILAYSRMVPGLTIAGHLVGCGTVVCRAWRAQIRHDSRVSARRPIATLGETSTPRRRASYKAAFCLNHLLVVPLFVDCGDCQESPHAKRAEDKIWGRSAEEMSDSRTISRSR